MEEKLIPKKKKKSCVMYFLFDALQEQEMGKVTVTSDFYTAVRFTYVTFQYNTPLQVQASFSNFRLMPFLIRITRDVNGPIGR